MTEARRITHKEFDRDWAPTRRTILRNGYLPFDAFEGNPFSHEDWPRALIANELFSPRIMDDEFDYPDVPPKIEHEYEPLLWTLQDLGIEEIALSTRDVDDPAAYPGYAPVEDLLGIHAVAPPSLPAIKSIRDGIWSHPYLVFSRDGTWGLVNFFLENCGVLAGTPAFMERFFRIAGGEQAVRERFYFHDIAGYWGFEDEDQKAVDFIYEWVGWPPPQYPDEKWERKTPL